MGRDPYFDVNGRSGPDVYAPPVNVLRAAPRPVRVRARISFVLGERAAVSMRIRRVHGRIVRRFRTRTRYVGRVSVRWIAHARLRPGRYRLVVFAWDDQGNMTRKVRRFRIVHR
jgi:hypothetical protein